jgi:hypothetical protein
MQAAVTGVAKMAAKAAILAAGRRRLREIMA